MASTYDSLLNIELQGTGENSGTWGTRLNSNSLALLAEAAHGVAAVTVSGSVTLTSNNGSSDQARKKILKFTGTGGTVTAPAREHEYFIINACSGALTFKSSATAGVSIPATSKVFVAWTGSAFEILDPVEAARDWATTTGAVVTGTAEYSAKEYAVGSFVPAGSAKEWAITTGATVDGSEYSSKEYALGTTVAAGSAKDWAQQTGTTVDGSEWSAKEYATGTDVPAGSAKEWATVTGTNVDGSEFSAKEYAVGTSVSTGSAKEWANDTSGAVASSEYSAKAYAVSAGLISAGSAKEWATKTGAAVAGGLYSALYYADQASTHATNAATAETNAETAEANAEAAQALAEAARDLAQNYAAALRGTSTSSLAIGTGSKTFATQADKQWTVGQTLRATYDATNYMTGIVTAYSGTSLTLNVQSIVGSGTYSSWTININGDKGDQGEQGEAGDQGPPGNGEFTLVTSTTVGTAVANVDFTGISSDFTELAVSIETAKHTSGSDQTLRLQYSVDNGSSWSTAIDINFATSSSATNRDGSIHLINFSAGRFAIFMGLGNTAGLPLSLGGSANSRVVARTTAKPNALRFSWSGGNHATGSVFTLVAR